MKTLAISLILTFSCSLLNAQFVNDGATIILQNGGYIYCNGDFRNNLGTITNNGKIEVQGNFQNAASYNSGISANDDSLIMSGSNNALLNGGASTISNLWINKTNASSEVKLSGSTNVGNKLQFDQGTVTTDPILNPSFVLSAPATATFSFAAGKEIIGRVKRTAWSNSSARVFNAPNMQITTTGGTSPTDITVNMIPQSASGDPSLNEREVKRKYEISKTGGAGYTASARFPYLASEINTNIKSYIAPWQYSGTEWLGKTASSIDTTALFVNITAIDSASFAKEWKLADARYVMNVSAYLRGAWNGTAMNTTLNTANVIPLSQPYNTTPWSYSGSESVVSIPVNVVDWVLVELRKPSSGLTADASASTIIGRKAGFLLSNGTVVNTDGTTPIAFNITKQGTSFLVVRHRNHLGVISNALTSNTTGTFTNDFSAIANVYKPSGASSDPLVLLSGVTGKYGMWAGDANKNGSVNVSDVNAVKLAISQSSTGYLNSDVNLSNSLNVTDVNLVKTTTSASGSGSGNGARASLIIASTNIPDGITNQD